MKLPVRTIIVTLASAAFAVACASNDSGKQEPEIRVCALVWPSCHNDPLSTKYVWPEGIGEWEMIRKGDKRFPEHYQPRQPLWGYEMDDDPRVVEKWIDTALDYGVNTFIYDWYWYKAPDGYEGPFLESALNNGFLKAGNCDKMGFYLMWANHTVTYNMWNCHKYGDNDGILFESRVGWDSFKVIVKRFIDYFQKPNYVKIDGCPVLAIFSFNRFIEGFGSLDEAVKAMDYLRAEVVKAGFRGLHLQEIQGMDTMETEENRAWAKQYAKALDVASETLYIMGGFDPDYLVHAQNALEMRKKMESLFDVPVLPCVSIGWDASPRYPEHGRNDVTHIHNSPTAFAAAFNDAVQFVKDRPEQPQFVVVNAWNEWIEGAYLLPDRLNGFGYLQAIRDVLAGKYAQPVYASR